MERSKLPNWTKYWGKYDDIVLLNGRSEDMDVTFQTIEAEFKIKLLSADHLEIIAALDERLEALEGELSMSTKGIQGELF